MATEKFGPSYDLKALLSSNSVSVGLFHTAGKGTRLAPLPASENNNKPGVKLPAVVDVMDSENNVTTQESLTILEAVVKQTGIYAASRKGRLSVFWGDQVFIPSEAFQYEISHHIDIMCTLGTMVDREEWLSRGLDKYGVIAVGSDGEAAQVEKVDYDTAILMLKSLGGVEMVGPSLGSFSVSAVMLAALCTEFRSELNEKSGKFDTDPHFWMPMTLKESDYVKLMMGKGTDAATATSHHTRMTRMKKSFQQKTVNLDNSSLGLFGAVNVGSEACWWDYGQLKLYSKNNLKLLENDENASLLRDFFGVTKRISGSTISDSVKICDASCVFASEANNGSISGSVLSCVHCGEIDANGAILVNVTAKSIKAAKGSILYNVVDDSEEGVVVGEGEVRVGVFDKLGGQSVVNSSLAIDGGKVWKEAVAGNANSFEGIHSENRNSDVAEIENQRLSAHKRLKLSITSR